MSVILYGLSGEGSGHVSRARALVPYLERAGYTVHTAGYGRATEQLKEKVKHYTDIFGFHIHYRDGKTDLLRTFVKNTFASPRAFRTMIKLDRLVEEIKPSLVICDFEPFVAYTSYRYGIPLISVDNQHALTNTVVTSNVRSILARFAAEAVTELVVPRARHFFITSFVPLKINRKNTTVIPPLVDPEIQKFVNQTNSHIMVYINNSSREGLLLPVLRKIKENFIVYGAKGESKGSITIRSFSRAGFLRDLAGAKAVIATAGFSLISEVLWLGRPILALPVQDQFEQLMNACEIESAGYGRACYSDPAENDVQQFLNCCPEFTKRLKHYPYRDLEAPLKIILKKVKEFC